MRAWRGGPHRRRRLLPSVPVDQAWRRFSALVPDAELPPSPNVSSHGVHQTGRGPAEAMRLAQGCALSPLLANLVLVDVDDALLEALLRHPVCRRPPSRADPEVEAWEALRCASAAVRRLGMELGADDTAIMSFDQGFSFSARTSDRAIHRSSGPSRRGARPSGALCVGTRARLSAPRAGVFVETDDDVELLSVPTGHVCRVVCFGSIGVSAGCARGPCRGTSTSFSPRVRVAISALSSAGSAWLARLGPGAGDARHPGGAHRGSQDRRSEGAQTDRRPAAVRAPGSR